MHDVRRVPRRIGIGFAAALLAVVALTTSATAEPCQPADQLDYVAMGDSFSSGYGLIDATGGCNRSAALSYPHRIQAVESFGSFTDISCSGARTRDFSAAQGSNPPQLSALSAETDVVTFTIGGNDLGFTSILTNCAAPGDCRASYGGPTMPTLLSDIHGSVGDRIEAAMGAVRQAAPNAQVFVLGYPDLLPAGPTGLLWGPSCLPVSTVISDEERTALRNVQATLNAEIEARATAVGANVSYVDSFTPSIGHDVCQVDGWVAVATQFHPTPIGHQGMADAALPVIAARLDAVCQASTTTTTTTTTTTAPPSSTSTSGPATTVTTAPGSTTLASTSSTGAGPSTTVAVGVGAGTVGPGGPGGSPAPGGLPRTGVDPGPLAGVGALLVLAGAALALRHRVTAA